MIKHIPISLFCVLCYASQVFGQNLVTNPGFESNYKCPNARSEIIYLPVYKWFPTVLDWVSPLNTTPDYFNRCATNPEVKLPNLTLDGYHEPHSGDACAGIAMFAGHPFRNSADYWAEYLETRLSSSMEAGHTYYISYYACLTKHLEKNYNIISIDNLGARLTTQMIDTICNAPMFFLYGPPDIQTPPGIFITDTKNWTLVSGIYHATGGEQWLTIGRFYSQTFNYKILSSPVPVNDFDKISSACYMLVDDVCVIDMSNPDVTDTDLYTPQFPVSIGLGKAEGQYEWDNGDTSLQIKVSAPGTYTRQRWSECGYYVDRFKIIDAPVDYCVWLPSAFTPNGDGKNDLFGPGNNYCHPDFSDFSFNIYNRWGQPVFQTINPGEKWDGRFGGVPQETGVYFYTLRYMYTGAFPSKNKSQGTSAFIRGDVTLIR